MSLWKRKGGLYWADFTVDGVRYRRPLGTKNWKDALDRERDMIEDARKGKLETRKGPTKLFEAIEAYLSHKEIACSPRTVELEGERLSIIKKHFNDVRLTEITVSAIEEYQAKRKRDGISNRTINMDIGALRRVLKRSGRWRRLEAKTRNLPENGTPVGRALKKEEKERLFAAAASNPEWEHVYCAAIIAANTSMRPVEVKNLRWQDVDLFGGTVTIRRSKNLTSHRVIPLNQSAKDAFLKMYKRAEVLGFTDSGYYIWPASQWGKIDPTQPTKKWDTVWRKLRDKAELPGLRFHDLRHTIITELAEMGVPDHVMESISGHLSRRMLEHYSHIRLDAKRRALDELELRSARAVPEQPAKAANQ